MSLKLKDLAYFAVARGREKKGDEKLRLKFLKLLKTHVEKMSAFRLSMIFMKTNESDTPRKAGGLMSGAASKAVTR
jgi:hypothetical protein